ncbi:MAG: hypothetical protein JWQ71_1933 [Pedosphaera sp.]|nr:hypothetical protein [Pedosphaera sp.]
MVETCVAVAVVGVFIVSLCGGLAMGTGIIRSSRERQRATQVMVEKFEMIRLYTWAQINSNGFVPTTFSAPFDPKQTNGGLVYNGRLSISSATNTGAYKDDLRQVTVQLTWTSGSLVATQSMTSLVARYGMQNYIY